MEDPALASVPGCLSSICVERMPHLLFFATVFMFRSRRRRPSGLQSQCFQALQVARPLSLHQRTSSSSRHYISQHPDDHRVHSPRAILQTIFVFKLCRFHRYSPFIIALCICLAAAVMSCTWLLNYLWENLRCCSSVCDGRAMLLIMQVVMKVLQFFRLEDFSLGFCNKKYITFNNFNFESAINHCSFFLFYAETFFRDTDFVHLAGNNGHTGVHWCLPAL
jgi:hypothetical protein